VTYADQTGHTAHRNKLSRHWTKEVELDRKPQDSGSEKASCSEQQCYRLFDTQGLNECIDWIHCGSPESDRTVCERRSPIVSSTGLRRLPFGSSPVPGRHRIRISPQSPSMLAGVRFRSGELARLVVMDIAPREALSDHLSIGEPLGSVQVRNTALDNWDASSVSRRAPMKW